MSSMKERRFGCLITGSCRICRIRSAPGTRSWQRYGPVSYTHLMQKFVLQILESREQKIKEGDLACLCKQTKFILSILVVFC